jgi:hypothetical protein
VSESATDSYRLALDGYAIDRDQYVATVGLLLTAWVRWAFGLPERLLPATHPDTAAVMSPNKQRTPAFAR